MAPVQCYYNYYSWQPEFATESRAESPQGGSEMYRWKRTPGDRVKLSVAGSKIKIDGPPAKADES